MIELDELVTQGCWCLMRYGPEHDRCAACRRHEPWRDNPRDRDGFIRPCMTAVDLALAELKRRRIPRWRWD